MRRFIGGLVGLVIVAGGVLGIAPAAAHAQPSVKWDSDGMAEIPMPPFTLFFELAEYSSPKEITQRAEVRVDISAEVDVDACAATIKATPLLDGVPVGDPAYLDAADSYAYEDYVSVWFPVSSDGTYSVAVEGSAETGSYSCAPGTTTSTPVSGIIDLFSLNAALPGPASARKVTVTSTGPHTLVANTWSKSAPIRITFTIRDPEHRKDLLHSICMQDTYDCWFEDAAIKPKSYIRKTSTGWVRTWDFWWERTSPSDCLTYYWQQPDVSVILVVSNRDGKVIGKKKHVVKLTCRR